MLLSVFYKEWLKTRWFVILYTLLGTIAIGYIFMALKHSFNFSGTRNIWSTILFQGNQFYKIFKFIPLAGGIIVAVSQYLPEANDKRIKLTFHLPLGENKALLLMQAFGVLSLLISFSVFLSLIYFVGLIYFPVQMAWDIILTILPWSIAGLSAYSIVSFVVLEPRWPFRFLYSIVGGLFLSFHFLHAGTASYGPASSGLFLMCLLLVTAPLSSGYRFRKG